MADNSGKKNVVDEIDREISDLFEDEASPEQPVEMVIKKGSVDVKKEQHAGEQTTEEEVTQKPEVEEISMEKTGSEMKEGVEQDFEKDGIIIKKE